MAFRRVLFRSDRKSTRLNSSHTIISYAVFCLKKKEVRRPRLQTGGAATLPRSTSTNPQHRGRGPTHAESLDLTSWFFFLKHRTPQDLPPFPTTAPLPT